jgi:putative transposase
VSNTFSQYLVGKSLPPITAAACAAWPVNEATGEEAGRTWIEVDPRHTSDGCEKCGYAAAENRVTQAAFECQRCSHRAPADEHAARNILRAGLALHTQAA